MKVTNLVPGHVKGTQSSVGTLYAPNVLSRSHKYSLIALVVPCFPVLHTDHFICFVLFCQGRSGKELEIP